jgi:hypothetical protein
MIGLAVLICLLALTASAVAQVTITKLWPNKLRYLNGEMATFEVRLKNTGAQAWQGRVAGAVESELNRTTPVFDREVTLAPGEEKTLQEQAKIQLPEFGATIHVTAKTAGGTAGPAGSGTPEAREVFCVGPWYYNTGRCTTIFMLRRFTSPEQVEAELIPKWRQWGVTCVEHFSGMPGIWGGMVPTTEEWYSGQGGYQESMTGEKSLIEACHRNGIAVTVYDIFGSYAAPGEEYSRAHPEMIAYNDRGRPEGWFNMAEMDRWRHMTEKNQKYDTPGSLCPYVADPKVQAFGVDEIIRCARLFQFDGVRWDGHTFGASYDISGKKLEGDLDALNAKWVRYMQSTLQQAIPGFTINYNYYPQGIEEGPKLTRTYQAMGPNSYILWESMRDRFKNANDPLNIWENFITAVRKEVNEYARAGGNFQHLGWYASDSKIHQNHTQAIYYALGAHWDTFGLPLKYDAFSLRYGAYLWDTKLNNAVASRPSDDPSTLVQVADPDNHLWWKQFVQERQLEAGRRLLVTHLINKPVHERQDPFEKDAPPVQRDVKVTLSLKPGEQVRAFILNPDATADQWCTEAPVSREGDKATVTVPSVESWSFVAWEVGK